MATVEVRSPTSVLLENSPKEDHNQVQETLKDEIVRVDDEVYHQAKEKDEPCDDHEEMIAQEVQSDTNTPSENIPTGKPNGAQEGTEDEIKDHEEEVDLEKEKEEAIDDHGEAITLEVERKLDIIEKKQEPEAEGEKEGEEKNTNEAKNEAPVMPIEDSNETEEVSEEGMEDSLKEKEEAETEKIV